MVDSRDNGQVEIAVNPDGREYFDELAGLLRTAGVAAEVAATPGDDERQLWYVRACEAESSGCGRQLTVDEAGCDLVDWEISGDVPPDGDLVGLLGRVLGLDPDGGEEADRECRVYPCGAVRLLERGGFHVELHTYRAEQELRAGGPDGRLRLAVDRHSWRLTRRLPARPAAAVASTAARAYLA